MPGDDTLTIDKLLEVKRLLESIPPPPFLAQSKDFPADKAIKFSHKGREYFGAHADFWKKLPRAEYPDGGPFAPFGAIVIYDLDAFGSDYWRSEFFGAMGAVMIAASPTPPPSPAATVPLPVPGRI